MSSNVKRICVEDQPEDYFHDILVINDSDLEEIESISSVSSNTFVSLIKPIQITQNFRWKSLLKFFIPCTQLKTIDETVGSDEDTLVEQETSSQLSVSNRGGRHGINGGFVPRSQSTPIISRGSIRACRYGNVGTRSIPPIPSAITSNTASPPRAATK